MSGGLRIQRLLKDFFFGARLHVIVPSAANLLIGNLARASRWIQNHRDVAFSDFFSVGRQYGKRYDLYEHIITAESLDAGIDYLEFGVAQGRSFVWWVERIQHPSARFVGFDTFTGLPEDWGPFRKGDMSNDNEPPSIEDDRCSFEQGLFQQTLPDFLKSYSPDRRKVIHMDADLYTSTLFVLASLAPYLRQNDILIFDEFNVPMHEFKAFIEWSEAFYVEYEVIGAVNNFYQVAIKLR